MTSKEREMLWLSLCMRICYIETGTVTMRANEAITQGKAELVQPLSREQREAVLEMEDLRDRILKTKVKD